MTYFPRLCLVTLGVFLFAGGIAQSESLTEAIDQVIKTNPQVRAQVYNRLARDQEIRQAESGYYPTLDVMAGGGFSEHQQPESESLNPREATISLRQNVFTGFATQNEISRQQARTRAAAYKVQGVSEYLALQASRVYLDVLRKEELKGIAQKNLDTHLKIMDKIKQRSDSGIGSRADTEQVQGRLALAQSNYIVAETNLFDSYSSYSSVIGHLPGDLIMPTSPGNKMPGTLEDAIAQARAGNPTLKSANADLEARKEQYEVAKSPYYPVFDLEVEQTWDDEISRIEEERDEFSAIARIRYNLFSGFKDESRKAESLQMISEAREIKNNTERQVVESMRLSWMAYQSNLNRIGYLEKHIAASIATARAYAQQFEIGKRSLLDVLNTEAEAINASADLVDAEFVSLQAQYRILNGMGKLVHSFDLAWPEEGVIQSDIAAK
jgi:adhesin transport system outer membrane protein